MKKLPAKKIDKDTILIIAEVVLILLGIAAIILVVINWRQEFYPVTDGEIII